MPGITHRDVEYRHGRTVMRGGLVSPAALVARPAVLLVHDAFGLSQDMFDIAERIARIGHPVFAADVWGDRRLPDDPEAAIGPVVADRAEWMGRLAAAVHAAGEQPEIDPQQLVLLGYCFGGSSALELLRTGARVRGVIAVHPGLDLLGDDWSAASPGSDVLLALGAEDPMATPAQSERLRRALDDTGIDWELDLYSGTVHAFTSLRATSSPAPHVFAYHPRNAERAWTATTRFLSELIPLAAGS
jgi:dienelactone hydrolase